MGIKDRRYMSRDPDDDPDDADDSGVFARPDPIEKANPIEAFFRRTYRKHPRLIKFTGLGIALLVVIGVIIAKLTSAAP